MVTIPASFDSGNNGTGTTVRRPYDVVKEFGFGSEVGLNDTIMALPCHDVLFLYLQSFLTFLYLKGEK
jgi:hypothetical protein